MKSESMEHIMNAVVNVTFIQLWISYSDRWCGYRCRKLPFVCPAGWKV